jgi:hypothetical protein
MKIRAPFQVIEVDNTDPAQATSTSWYLYGISITCARVFDPSKPWKTSVKTLWGYWRQSYLGSMLLSLPSQTYTWRKP